MADLRLAVEIAGKDVGAGKVIGETESGLASLTKTAGVAGKAVLAVGTVATGALVAGLGASVVAASGFEQTMSAVKAVSGATQVELKGLSDLALQLGADTSFSAKEAAAGIEELVKGGVGIPDIMGGALESVLALAAAGGVALPDSAEIASNAMSIFSLKGADMAMVADQIAGAVNASSLGVMDFKMSMAAAGTVMAGQGQTFESTATAIALLGAAGIKGSDAGTSLKTMFSNLIPQTKAQTKAMLDLGLWTQETGSAFVNLDGSFKDVRDIAGLLNKSLMGLSEAERSVALETIFGSDAQRAALVLTKDGTEGYDKMAASIGKVTAAQVATERLNNLQGSVEALKGSVETASIKLGMAFLPLLKDLVDAGTGAVNGLLPLIDVIGPKLAASVGQGVTFLGSFLDDIHEFTKMGDIQQMSVVFGLLNQVNLAPLGATIMTLANIVKQAFSGDITGAVQGLLSYMVDSRLDLIEIVAGWGAAVIDWIAPRIPDLTTAIGEFASSMYTFLTETMLPEIVTRVTAWGEAIVAWVSPYEQNLLGQLDMMGLNVRLWVTNQAAPLAQEFVTAWLPAAINWVTQAGIDLVPEVGNFLNTLLEQIDLHGPALVEEFLATWLPAAIGWLAQAAIQIVPKLVELNVAIGKWVLFEGVPRVLKIFVDMGAAVVRGIVRGITENADDVLAYIISLLGNALDGALRFIGARSPSRLWSEEIGVPIVEGIVGGMEEATPLLLEQINQTLGEATGAAQEELDKLVGSLKNQLTPAFTLIGDAVIDPLLEQFDRFEGVVIDLDEALDDLAGTILGMPGLPDFGGGLPDFGGGLPDFPGFPESDFPWSDFPGPEYETDAMLGFSVNRGGGGGGGVFEIDYDRLARALAAQPIRIELDGRQLATVVRDELVRLQGRNVTTGLT